jgi:hypothetical protein
MNNETNVLTETIELPSKGLLYPPDHPLSSGTIEMKYMTAREEEILTNQNYIQKGTVLDKVLQSLIVTKFDYNDLLIGDKNALLFAARVLSYGAEYPTNVNHPETKEKETIVIDLSQVDSKPLHPVFEKCEGVNNFEFELSHSKIKLTFKLLTHRDEKSIEDEMNGYKKMKKEIGENLVRLERIITSVNGDTNKAKIKEFVYNQFLARDVREFRNYIREISPDVNSKVNVTFSDGYVLEGLEVPITLNFFWPDVNF